MEVKTVKESPSKDTQISQTISSTTVNNLVNSPYSISQSIRNHPKRRSFSAKQKEPITPRIPATSKSYTPNSMSTISNVPIAPSLNQGSKNTDPVRSQNSAYPIPQLKQVNHQKVVSTSSNATPRRIASASSSRTNYNQNLRNGTELSSSLQTRRPIKEPINSLNKSYSDMRHSSPLRTAAPPRDTSQRGNSSGRQDKSKLKPSNLSYQQIITQFDEVINPTPPNAIETVSPASFRRFRGVSDSTNHTSTSIDQEYETDDDVDAIDIRENRENRNRRNEGKDDPVDDPEDVAWHRASEKFEAEMRMSDSFLDELSSFNFNGSMNDMKLTDFNESYSGGKRSSYNGLSPSSKSYGSSTPRELSQSKVVASLYSIHERVAQHVEKELSDIIVDIQKEQEEKRMENLHVFKQQVQERNSELVQRTKQVMQNMKRMLDNLKKQKDDLISGFVKQKKDYIEEIRHLELQLKISSKNIKQLEFEKQKLLKNTSVDALKRRMDSLQKENDQLMLENSQLKSVVHKTEEQKIRLDQDLKFKTQEFEKSQQDLKQLDLEKERLNDHLKAADQKIVIIQNHNDSLQRQILGFQESIGKSEVQLKKQHSIVQSHLDEIEKLTRNSSMLQEKVNDLQKIETLYKSSQEEIVQLKVELSEQKSTVSALKEKLSSSEETSREKLKTLWQKHKALKASREELTSEIQQLTSTIEKLQKENSNLKQEHDRISKETSENASQLQSEHRATEVLLSETKEKLKVSTDTVRTQSSEILALKESLEKEIQLRTELEASVQRLNDMILEKQEQVKTLLEDKDNATSIRFQLEQLEKKNQTLQNQIKTNNEQLSIVLAKDEQQKEYIKNIELKMKMAQMSKENISEQLKSSQSQLDSTIKEKELALEMVNTLEQKNAQLMQNIQRLKEGSYGIELEEYNQLQHDHRNAVKGLEELRVENAKLKKSISQYRGVIQSLRYQYNTK